jgi:hypothetical protein
MSINDRRHGARHFITFPVRVEWKDDSGQPVAEDGLTENVGPQGVLIHLPRLLPSVGGKVNLVVTENSKTSKVKVTATVLRLERNAAHPQAALQLTAPNKDWEKKVWEYAGRVLAEQKPDEFEDWN